MKHIICCLLAIGLDFHHAIENRLFWSLMIRTM